MYRILCLSLFSLIFFIQDLEAQKYTYYSAELAREKSQEHIHALKDGILIVRLESYEKQINQMKSMLIKKEIDQKKRELIKRELNNYKEKREREAKEIITAFDEKYNFCPVYFTWDKDYNIEKQIEGSLQLLNSDLGYEDELLPKDEMHYILTTGLSHPSVKPEQYGWIIMDRDHLVLQKPFPYFLKEMGFGFFHSIEVIFGTKKDHLNYPKMVLKLNERLHKAYSKT